MRQAGPERRELSATLKRKMNRMSPGDHGSTSFGRQRLGCARRRRMITISIQRCLEKKPMRHL